MTGRYRSSGAGSANPERTAETMESLKASSALTQAKDTSPMVTPLHSLLRFAYAVFTPTSFSSACRVPSLRYFQGIDGCFGRGGRCRVNSPSSIE